MLADVQDWAIWDEGHLARLLTRELVTREPTPLEALLENPDRSAHPLPHARQFCIAHAHLHRGGECRSARDARAHESCPYHTKSAHGAWRWI